MKKYLTMFMFLGLMFVFMACTGSPTTETNIAEMSDQIEGFSSYDDLRNYFQEMNQDYNTYGWRNDGVVATPEQSTDDTTGEEKDTYSETNVQVEGVAEMDTIITDGTYIYMANNHQLRIIDVASMTILYENTLEEGYYQGIYLYEDRLIALYNTYVYNNEPSPFMDMWWGYSVLHVDVFDVSDKDNVDLVRSLAFSNTYLTDSRMIGGQVYLVMSAYQRYIYEYEDDVDDQTGLTTTEDEQVFTPFYKDSLVSDEFMPLSYENIYYFTDNDFANQYLLIGTFSVLEDQAIDLNAYLGYAFEVYMNHQNLYLSGHQYIYDPETQTTDQKTSILRFEIVDQQLVFRASNQIQGWTLNQFSFDEYDGVLRVATTDRLWDGTQSTITNQLYLLNATDDDLTIMSILEGLGKPNERIYAVRMSGDIGYVVTFVNTDPLYKIDLSDPENPEILGELYEEGVSDYLHPVNDDLMIGVGRQAEKIDGFVRFTGVKVALYDVSGDDPITIETLYVEGEYSYSPVTYDHKLFVEYEWNDTYLFAIPVFGYGYEFDHYYQAIYVYEVTDNQALIQKAILLEEAHDYYYYNYIEKAIFINDSIYTISFTQINQYDMSNDFEHIDSLILEAYERDTETSEETKDEENTDDASNPDDTTSQ